jgi:undecaprenyl-diphosphatase
MTATDHPHPRRFGRLRTLLLLCVAGAIGFGSLAAGVERSEHLVHLDDTVANDLHQHALASPGWVRFFLAVTRLGTFPWLATLSVLAIATMWWLGQRRLALAWLIVLVGSGLLIELLKDTFDRPRPPFNHFFTSEDSYSFPSGHAAGSGVAYGMLAYCLALRWPDWRRRLAVVVVLGLLVLVIGFSRLYLGVHYLSDVLAGYALALAWLALSVWAIEWIRARLSKLS